MKAVNEHAHARTILEGNEYYTPLRRVIDDPHFNFRRLRGKWQEPPVFQVKKRVAGPLVLRRGRVAVSAKKNEENYRDMLKRLKEHENKRLAKRK
jgi:hypothetical protein